MKKYSILFCLFLQMALAFAQAPNKMSYQAVIRNSNNTVVSNHAVGMRISILQGTATGSSVYTETQSPTTNANGLIAIEIGTGNIISGSFANIDWANGPYFVKTETDPNGGSTNYTLTGTSQLLSVPYALYAKKTDTSNVAKVALNGVPSGGLQGQFLTNCYGTPMWTNNGLCPPKVLTLNCSDTIHHGEIYINSPASKSSWAYSEIGYTGGTGFLDLKINSTGVIGLVATAHQTLETTYTRIAFFITGTPNSIGIANFTFEIDGKTCTFYRTVVNPYPLNAVNCNSIATAIVDVTSATTGKTWMDRNLGASQAATSISDSTSFGDLYQWGRRADGHQCRNSSTTLTLSSIDQPNHSKFIIGNNINPLDWRSPANNNLWQGLNGINNPCPKNYRLPTYSELDMEIKGWNTVNTFDNELKLPSAGLRSHYLGSFANVGINGYYWSSTISSTLAWQLTFSNSSANVVENYRASGLSVRCIKD